MPRRSRPRRSWPGRIPAGFWTGALALGFVLASVWSQSRVDHLAEQLSEERERCRELEGRVEMLSQRTHRFSSLREVAPHARRELGLAAQDTDRIIVVEFEDGDKGLVPDLVPEAYAGVRENGDR